MATIRARRRRDGSLAYLAEVRIKRNGRLLRESKTFERRGQATEWAAKAEKQLSTDEDDRRQHRHLHGGSLRRILRKYRKEVSDVRPMGRSKTAHIKFLEKMPLAAISVLDLRPSDLIQHVRQRRKSGAGPATVNNDLIWLRIILRYARAAWGLPFDLDIVDDACEVVKSEKLVAKSRQRFRRPTKDELERLTEYFRGKEKRRSSMPMRDIMWFAIHSARRQSEITGLLFGDNDAHAQTGAVRNLKHPTERSQFRRFKYTPEAWKIVQRQDPASHRIFPYDPKSVGAAFTRACRMLQIEDLRFHDLRHEATSRLFETGYSIVEVQQFTLHDSWGTLSRYTHLRPEGVTTRNVTIDESQSLI
jgi:integrase